ncbi:hypothetical protein PR048_021573 [Dryococelus australis]|uniref:DUF4371 domain-containing protein n=1 Tax=Dryococelus australis TaxID=614101 RepID=A0ABQ9GYM5_9NEOP|nr:hypothetical protein PR048_021573 [Dryococelus australis]
MASGTVSVRYSTFMKWENELDTQNTWFKCEKSAGNVTSENLLNMLNQRCTRMLLTLLINLHQFKVFFVKTPVGKAVSSVSDETKYNIGKLVNIAYVLAQEEIEFNKFPKLIDIGETYATVLKGEEFTSCIVITLKIELINNLRNTDYLTICCYCSTDVSVTEKEIVSMMFINKDTSAVEFKYLKITDLPNFSASAIFNNLKDMCIELKILKEIILFVFWQMAHLKILDIYMLLAIHCLSHCLELSVKCYIQLTYLIRVFKILGEVCEFYSKSPSHIHQFQQLAMVLDEENAASVPTSRIQGVRWVSRKKKC